VAASAAQLGVVTITQRLLAVASARGDHRALVGGADGADYSYADLAVTVQAAAAGLAWRGLQPRDVVGVHVADAVSHVLATHSIRAAGGVPAPVSASLKAAEIAWQLAECGARMLLTAAPNIAASLAAADRSRVRQVISFGEAPGTIPFSALLGMGSLRPASAKAHDLALLPYARQADGTLSPVAVTHVEVAAELDRLAGQAGITERDVVLAAPPAGDGRAYSALIENALLSGATIVAARADQLAEAACAHRGTAMIAPLGIHVGAPEPLRVFAVA
jgi:acyl-CoA synthetase (AMP-forming)/AMP-acid ligase II